MNINAINKIIYELSQRDYLIAWAKYPEPFKRYYRGITTKKPRNYTPFSYVLGADTKEAIEIRKAYEDQKISENDYKAYCLRFNLKRG